MNDLGGSTLELLYFCIIYMLYMKILFHNLTSKIQLCFNASLAVIRFVGSHLNEQKGLSNLFSSHRIPAGDQKNS